MAMGVSWAKNEPRGAVTVFSEWLDSLVTPGMILLGLPADEIKARQEREERLRRELTAILDSYERARSAAKQPRVS